MSWRTSPPETPSLVLPVKLQDSSWFNRHTQTCLAHTRSSCPLPWTRYEPLHSCFAVMFHALHSFGAIPTQSAPRFSTDCAATIAPTPHLFCAIPTQSAPRVSTHCAATIASTQPLLALMRSPASVLAICPSWSQPKVSADC